MLREVVAGIGLLVALAMVAAGFWLAWSPLGLIVGGAAFGWWVLAAVSDPVSLEDGDE